ncbi:MAG: phage/plasmid primase, P4 family, partial [Acidobacteria bacterium]|nr:phage/plasmid primase, P4 family [Acidobacteriota bacterium]
KGKSWSPDLASKVEAYLCVDCPDLWERPPMDTLNVRNGLLDVATRVLRQHDPMHLSPVQIDVDFNGDAGCPAIEAFIADVFPTDAQHIPAEVVAWLMLPDSSIQKAVLAVGEGSNGKSVFLSLLERFIGRKNVAALSLHKIEADKFAAARLVGKLANICPDLPTVTLAGTSMFKALTGGDTISAERKFEASFEFRPYCRLVFSANSAPRSDDATHGFFRRWLVIPFTRTFDETDPRTVTRAELDARLSARNELSGLLNRALDALPQIRTGRFNESQSMRDAWQDFRRTTDPLAVWLDSNTVDQPEAYVAKARLRNLYAGECKDSGRPIPPESVFTERLKRLRPKVGTKQPTVDGRPKTWCFTGIALRADEEPPADGQMRF